MLQWWTVVLRVQLVLLFVEECWLVWQARRWALLWWAVVLLVQLALLSIEGRGLV